MSTPWIVRKTINPEARLRLFCFAPAGGAAMAYFPLAEALPATIEVCPVELPGHGARWREAACPRLSELVAALVEALPPYLEGPYAFFGHSMGALIAFELARALRRAPLPLPARLFVSAYRAPHLPSPELLSKLSDAELMRRIQQLGGTPPEVLQQPELLALIVPALRADFELLDTYSYAPEAPLPCAITAFGGMQDAMISRVQLEAWREHTQADFIIQMFPGGHFYLQTAQALFLGVLSQALAAL